jgi:hypothetical protein
MKKAFFVAVVFLFTACNEIGSGKTYPILGVSLGDLQETVLQKRGVPEAKNSSADHLFEAWNYSKKFTEFEDITLQYKIIFNLKNDKFLVTDFFCGIENYESGKDLGRQSSLNKIYNDENICALNGVKLFSSSDALIKKFGEPSAQLSVNNARSDVSAVAFVYENFIFHVFHGRVVEIYYGEHCVSAANSTHVYPPYWY